MNNSGKFRRSKDYPLLVLSQDYELFFHVSGSIDKCLIEPCDLLLEFAQRKGIQITFFVDAGMLCAMQRLAPRVPTQARALQKVQRHLESLVAAGHEIGLHVHPHWEDTRWQDGQWVFSDTRYQVSMFSDAEIADIFQRYTAVLNDLCGGGVSVYRAGGFCIEPFSRIRQALAAQNIWIDSSVVPGAVLEDPEKGFDFRAVDDVPFWSFNESPLIPVAGGEFMEIAVTPHTLPFFHYWRRAIDRALKRQPAAVIGDGASKVIGRREIIRRLTGSGRTSELSIDAPKAGRLAAKPIAVQRRQVWQIMGHPKLLGRPSLVSLQSFLERHNISRFETVGGFARSLRSKEAA